MPRRRHGHRCSLRTFLPTFLAFSGAIAVSTVARASASADGGSCGRAAIATGSTTVVAVGAGFTRACAVPVGRGRGVAVAGGALVGAAFGAVSGEAFGSPFGALVASVLGAALRFGAGDFGGAGDFPGVRVGAGVLRRRRREQLDHEPRRIVDRVRVDAVRRARSAGCECWCRPWVPPRARGASRCRRRSPSRRRRSPVLGSRARPCCAARGPRTLPRRARRERAAHRLVQEEDDALPVLIGDEVRRRREDRLRGDVDRDEAREQRDEDDEDA